MNDQSAATSEQRLEWARLSAAATPGPWKADTDVRGDCVALPLLLAENEQLRAQITAAQALVREWILEANDDVPVGVLAIRAALAAESSSEALAAASQLLNANAASQLAAAAASVRSSRTGDQK